MKSYKILLILFLCSCEPVNRYFGIEDDNITEETVEYLIEHQFHLDVDLTPSSPEN